MDWEVLWRKWPSITAEFFITTTSFLVFLFLDLIEVILCVFYRYVDELLEGKAAPCYCQIRTQHNGAIVECERESLLSETLFARKNIFREKGLLRFATKWEDFRTEDCGWVNQRWSDCGCESCVSWTTNDDKLRLHVVVKAVSEEEETENVIFLHGFMSSSSFWTETIFPNISLLTNRKFRFFAVDLLGFGRSPKPRDCLYTLKDHLDMIENSTIFPSQLNSFHLVAHSMGCVLALALAARHPHAVKSITLFAPPYLAHDKEEEASLMALERLAIRRIWPPLLFGSAVMSWYEHLGRCVCFVVCRNHKIWEGILKLITGRRNLDFKIMDMTRHTHHSAWHTMHNVICGGAKFVDGYLEILKRSKVKINVIQGGRDKVVPPECSANLKKKVPDADIHIIPNADHSVIFGRENDLTRYLETIWWSWNE
ncbi:probable lysophospholipase BODYGUARD 4 isoform X2 [Impatiens glandulifera]|uniref:probable lysophospholipase BODYGUARD 4 isoform X2 n=1 Tax=Impatiens glandulifera TaxID=253017 RepID=UPI001FB0BD26|nr:probable lysophospholipase BODYGUARD 4 isoform X2 [Impatiens glandulifera]